MFGKALIGALALSVLILAGWKALDFDDGFGWFCMDSNGTSVVTTRYEVGRGHRMLHGVATIEGTDYEVYIPRDNLVGCMKVD